MGFSLRSFLGGAAGAGSRGLEERRINLQREKETAEARQWQIATEGRADSRARKKARAAKKRQAEERAESLALFYTPDQVKDILGGGKTGVEYALKYGADMAAEGKNAAELYRSTSTASAIPSAKVGTVDITSPFSHKFPYQKDEEEWATSLSGMLSQNLAKTLGAKDNPDLLASLATEKTSILNSIKEHTKAANKDEESTGAIDIFSANDKTMNNMENIFNKTIKSTIALKGLGEYDRVNDRLILREGDKLIVGSAKLAGAVELETTYTGLSPMMVARSNRYRENVIAEIKSNAVGMIGSFAATENNNFQGGSMQQNYDAYNAAVNSNKIREGTLVKIGNTYQVYTGQPTVLLENGDYSHTIDIGEY